MRLILNADDFGACEDTVRATIGCFAEGALTSATIMVGKPATEAALTFARANPQHGFGVHLRLVADGDADRPVCDPAAVPAEQRLQTAGPEVRRLVAEEGWSHGRDVSKRLLGTGRRAGLAGRPAEGRPRIPEHVVHVPDRDTVGVACRRRLAGRGGQGSRTGAHTEAQRHDPPCDRLRSQCESLQTASAIGRV